MIKKWNKFNENYIQTSSQKEDDKYDNILFELKKLNLTSEQIQNLIDEYFLEYKENDKIDIDKTLKKMAKYFTNRKDEYKRFMNFFKK